LGKLFAAQLVLNAIFGFVIGSGLALIGVPSAPLWGLFWRWYCALCLTSGQYWQQYFRLPSTRTGGWRFGPSLSLRSSSS
jgi:hypothetical protein